MSAHVDDALVLVALGVGIWCTCDIVSHIAALPACHPIRSAAKVRARVLPRVHQDVCGEGPRVRQVQRCMLAQGHHSAGDGGHRVRGFGRRRGKAVHYAIHSVRLDSFYGICQIFCGAADAGVLQQSLGEGDVQGQVQRAVEAGLGRQARPDVGHRPGLAHPVLDQKLG